jgi:hypothetical protein
MAVLIGINGEIGCGKSTACEFLQKQYGFTEYMFAKPLKDIAVILGFEPSQVFGTQEQKLEVNQFWGVSGRKFLQIFGSEVCRDFVPTVLNMNFNGNTMWVRLFEKYYANNANKSIVVSDLRFEDESNAIKKLDGYVIRIERDCHKSTELHKSELQADKIKPHVIIKNNGSLLSFQFNLIKVIEMINNGSIHKNEDNPIYIE